MATPPAAGSRLLTSHPNRPRRAPPLSIVFVTREGAILARHASDLKGSGGLRRKKKGGEGCITDSEVSCIVYPSHRRASCRQPTYLPIGFVRVFSAHLLAFLSFFLFGLAHSLPSQIQAEAQSQKKAYSQNTQVRIPGQPNRPLPLSLLPPLHGSALCRWSYHDQTLRIPGFRVLSLSPAM